MSDAINSLFEPLKNVSYDVYVFIISMVPIIELRGAIPIGIALGMEPLRVYVISVLGSVIPGFFLILLFERILRYMEEKGILKKLINWLNIKFTEKSKKIGGAKFIGIMTFTAVPFPGTGVWSASAIASLIKMDYKKAFLAVVLGDAIAGIIVLIVSNALI